MCVPYASDQSGMPAGGFGGLAGTNADLFKTIGGTAAQSLAGITGSGTVPTVPTAGSTVLSGGSANTGLSPETPALPKTEPVSGTPAAIATKPPPWPGWGKDPLPQTSGHTDIVSQTGHDSLSPLADAIIARRGGGTGGTVAVPGTVPASAPPAAAAAAAVDPAATTTKLAPGQLPDDRAMEAYIRDAATKRGIDPDTAVAVAKSEALGSGTWQSNIAGGGGPGNREPSFGPFQLHDRGMGADFTAATGLRASDPNTWQAQIDFALDQATTKGWEPFHGAARVGIGTRQGLDGSKSLNFGRGPGVAANGAPLIAFGESAALPGTEAVSSADPGALAAAGMETSPARPAVASRINYANKGSIRSQPLAPKLEGLLGQAAQAAGIDEIRVVSGGQPSSGPNRTGSHRHDDGGAGDLQLVANGHVLDMTNAADLEIIKKFISEAHRLGATGIGASPAYMGSRTFHVGFGTPAVWGAGGQGKNAPAWLVAATRGRVDGSPETAVATDTTSDGGIGATLTAGLRGGGAGGGRVPASGMDALIEEWLTSDAARRKKERERVPAIGELPVQAANMVPGKDIVDVGSLAQILGVS